MCWYAHYTCKTALAGGAASIAAGDVDHSITMAAVKPVLWKEAKHIYLSIGLSFRCTFVLAALWQPQFRFRVWLSRQAGNINGAETSNIAVFVHTYSCGELERELPIFSGPARGV